jgi:aryl-alcohol dehydrogenase-like predicted oxidoreductase
VRTVRGKLQILGKVGLRWDAGEHGEILFETADDQGRRRQVRRDSRPESVLEEVTRSLERLDTDYLDLVQIHQPDLHTPIDETMGALLDLHRSGMVRHIGVSNFSRAADRSGPAGAGRSASVYRAVGVQLAPPRDRKGCAAVLLRP